MVTKAYHQIDVRRSLRTPVDRQRTRIYSHPGLTNPLPPTDARERTQPMSMVTFTDPNRMPVLVADPLIARLDDKSTLTTPDHPHGISSVFPQSIWICSYVPL